jgi:FlaA1/EpsC-like NDP-sugar epimerase
MDIADFYKGKDVLVTGGCGSIGSRIVEHLLGYDVKRVRVLDSNESAQFYLQKKFAAYGKIRSLMGDVRDKERMKKAMDGVDVAFHCAALKHVPLCEYNPFEAVNTNVIGTQNAIDAAKEMGVGRFIAVSTDKAVNPINTMGATKLLSEKLVMTASVGEVKTLFSCVRLGNVLNSSGSVVPTFVEQIKNGEHVTVTSRDMVRFFTSISSATGLILKAAQETRGREIFVLKMKALRIMDLAEVMIRELAPRYGRKPEDIKVDIIGVRPGEKLYELLMGEEEAGYAEDRGDMFVIRPTLFTPHHQIGGGAVQKPVEPKYYDARKAELLTKKEISALLKSEEFSISPQ